MTNGNFATGDFTGWATTETPDDIAFTNGPGGFPTLQVRTNLPTVGHNTASFGGFTDPVGDTLTQTINTVIGTQYTFSFQLQDEAQGGSHFDAEWNGMNILAVGDVAAFPFTPYSFTETATSTTTAIYFDGSNGNAWFNLSNVSVMPTPAPEPSSLLLLAAGAVGLLLAARRRRA